MVESDAWVWSLPSHADFSAGPPGVNPLSQKTHRLYTQAHGAFGRKYSLRHPRFISSLRERLTAEEIVAVEAAYAEIFGPTKNDQNEALGTGSEVT